MKEFIEQIVSCPILCTEFTNPTITNCGQTYEGAFLNKYLSSGKNADPLAGEPITTQVPNLLLNSLIELLNIDELSNELTIKQENQLYELLMCPLSKKLFQDPVVTNHGQTYERSALKNWMDKENSNCDPISKKPITFLIKNFSISSLVDEYRQVQKINRINNNQIASAIFEEIKERPVRSLTRSEQSFNFFQLPRSGLSASATKDMTVCILNSIFNTLDVFESLHADENRFDMYLLTTMGATKNQFLSCFENLSEPEDVLLKFRALMMYQSFKQWHDTSIQQIFLLIISHRIDLPNLTNNWAGLKNSQDYFSYCMDAFFKKIAQAEKSPIETSENTETSTHVDSGPQKQVSECDDDNKEKSPIETNANTKTSAPVESAPQKQVSDCDDDNKEQVPHKITFGDFFFTAFAVYKNGGDKVEQLAAQNANRPRL